jgi:hypothetical protein
LIKRILALALAFTLLLAGCSQGEQKEEKPQLVLQNAAKAIKEHSDADTVEILALEPAPQPPEYYALVQLTDDAGAVSKRFYHLVKGENAFTVLSPYYFDSQPEMAISANYEILGNNTVVYGEINWGHTSSREKAFLPIEVSRIDLRLEGGEFASATLYKGAYLCVFKGKKAPLAQAVFFDTPREGEEPTAYDYAEELDYLLSLNPPPPDGPLYTQYEEGSDAWYLARYIHPLAFSGLLTGESWSRPGDLPLDGLLRFAAGLPSLDEEADYTLFWDNEGQNYQVPAAYLEGMMGRYFDLPEGLLRGSPLYREEEEVYLLPALDFSGEAAFSLDQVEPLDGGVLRLTFSAYGEEPTGDSLPIRAYTLTVKVEGGSFQYLSCTVLPLS